MATRFVGAWTLFKDGNRVTVLGRGLRRVPMLVVVFGVNYELQNILRGLNTPGRRADTPDLRQHERRQPYGRV